MAKKKIDNELKIISTPDIKPAKGFQKGNSGRPKGAVAKVTADVKQAISNVVENRLLELNTDLDNMSPTSKWMVLMQIMKFAYPTLSSQKLDADITTDNKIEIVISYGNKDV